MDHKTSFYGLKAISMYEEGYFIAWANVDCAHIYHLAENRIAEEA